LKILQVIDILNVGGAERVFVDLTNILYKHNEDVTALFILSKGPLYNILNQKIPVHELNRKNKFSIYTLYKCSRLLTKYNIIHCHSKHVFRYIKLVCLTFRVKTPIILQDHYLTNSDNEVPLFMKNIFRPNIYIGVSNQLTEWAYKTLRLKPNKIYLLENIVIKQNITDSNQLIYDFILVSNIKKIKNQEFAIELANKIKDKQFLIVGNIQDENYYKILKCNVKFNNVTFQTSVENTQPILKTARMGLHVSPSETGPLVIIEYLAQGVPFLAFDTGEVSKILKVHFPLFFIDNFNHENWINRIEEILKMPNLQLKMQEVFESNFNSYDYYLKCKKIYTDLNN
jgi:glycosyltransferase involved in cell wall biosynthesis